MSVSRFLQNAAKILEAAESVASSQSSLYPELTISISPEGGIRVVTQGTGLPLDVLQQEHGAQMIYRVTQQESRVRLEGRAGSRTCLFEAEKPDGVARILLGDGPRYTMSSPGSTTTALAVRAKCVESWENDEFGHSSAVYF